MKPEKIKPYMALLNVSNSQETLGYVERQIKNMDISMKEFYGSMEMASDTLELYRDEGGFHTFVQLHTHMFYEVIFCQSTCGAEYLVGSDRYKLQRGDLLFISPRVEHTPLVRSDSCTPYKGCALLINPDFFSQLCRQFPDFTEISKMNCYLMRTQDTIWEYVDYYFRTALEESERKGLGWEASVYGSMILMLTYAARAISHTSLLKNRTAVPELLESILSYVELHFHEKLTLEMVANHFYIGQSSLTLLFRKSLGVSFYKYLTQLRLSKAVTMMYDHTPLEKIAVQVGFGDYSTFYRSFKQEYGVSPREYSRRHCSK